MARAVHLSHINVGIRGPARAFFFFFFFFEISFIPGLTLDYRMVWVRRC
jgi:hypothetical protein